MDQARFEAVIRSKLSELGELPEQRRRVYRGLRSALLGNAAKSPQDAARWESALPAFDAAVEAVEEGYVLAAADFESFIPPDATPRTVSDYFWFNVAAGCGIFAGVLDFLKPIVNLQSPAVMVAALAAIVLTVAGRLLPGRQRLFTRLRNLAVAAAIAVIGLFGLQSQFPGNAPNGAIAEVLPDVERLQAAIERLRDPIEKIGRDTGQLVEDTRRMRETLDGLAADSDGVAQARAEIEKRGYTVDRDGLLRAIRDESDVRYYFSSTDYIATADDYRYILLQSAEPAGETLLVLDYLKSSTEPPYRRELQADLATLRGIYEAREENWRVFLAACGGNDSGLPAWFAKAVSARCAEPAAAYEFVLRVLERADANPNQDTMPMVPGSLLQARPFEAIEDATVRTGLFYVETEFYVTGAADRPSISFVGENSSRLHTIVGNSRDPALSDCGPEDPALCRGRIFIWKGAPNHVAYHVGSSDIEVVKGSRAGEIAAASAAQKRWTYGALPGGSRINYVAGWHGGSGQPAIGVFCGPEASPTHPLMLSFKLSASNANAADLFLYPKTWPAQGTTDLLVDFPGSSSGYEAPALLTARRYSVTIHPEMISRMVKGSTMVLSLGGQRVTVPLNGFGAMLDRIRAEGDCL